MIPLLVAYSVAVTVALAVLALKLRAKKKEKAEAVAHYAEAQAELDGLIMTKQDFLAVMSHELRTPLTSIIGYASLLEEDVPCAVPERAKAEIHRIVEASHQLLAQIEQILLYNSLESAQEKLELQPVNVAQTVIDVHCAMIPAAKNRGLAIAVAINDAVTLQTDGPKLRRILMQLVGNALKFTREGQVFIDVQTSEHAVVFAVSDPGVGIDPDDQRHVFEPLWQARQSAVREVGGMGLGLAVSKRLAVLLGGTLDVRSEPGQGSTFTLHLPR